MTTSQPTNLQLTTPNPIVGVSLLAMTTSQPTNPQLTTPNPIVGVSLLAMTTSQPTNLQLTAPQSNCGSELAREGGLPANQPPTDHPQSLWELACQR